MSPGAAEQVHQAVVHQTVVTADLQQTGIVIPNQGAAIADEQEPEGLQEIESEMSAAIYNGTKLEEDMDVDAHLSSIRNITVNIPVLQRTAADGGGTDLRPVAHGGKAIPFLMTTLEPTAAAAMQRMDGATLDKQLNVAVFEIPDDAAEIWKKYTECTYSELENAIRRMLTDEMSVAMVSETVKNQYQEEGERGARYIERVDRMARRLGSNYNERETIKDIIDGLHDTINPKLNKKLKSSHPAGIQSLKGRISDLIATETNTISKLKTKVAGHETVLITLANELKERKEKGVYWGSRSARAEDVHFVDAAEDDRLALREAQLEKRARELDEREKEIDAKSEGCEVNTVGGAAPSADSGAPPWDAATGGKGD